jgi:hypothetical protein
VRAPLDRSAYRRNPSSSGWAAAVDFEVTAADELRVGTHTTADGRAANFDVADVLDAPVRGPMCDKSALTSLNFMSLSKSALKAFSAEHVERLSALTLALIDEGDNNIRSNELNDHV